MIYMPLSTGKEYTAGSLIIISCAFAWFYVILLVVRSAIDRFEHAMVKCRARVKIY